MRIFFVFLSLCITGYCYYTEKWPTIGISVLARNKAHSLPFFFSCLNRIDYPKDRIYVKIWSDHNQDRSDAIIREWIENHKNEYKNIFYTFDKSDSPTYEHEVSPSQWTDDRFQNVIKLREEALKYAREYWVDFHFMLDADVYLTEPFILKNLTRKPFTVFAPMLQSDGLYSNFWAAMTETGYYKRSERYSKIRKNEIEGCFEVPMIHTAVMINMNHVESDILTYDSTKVPNYDGPIDDVIIFATSAANNNVGLYVCNDVKAGYVQVPLPSGEGLEKEVEQLINIKTLALTNGIELPLDSEFKHFVQYPKPSKFGLDEIYMINLERRKERKEYMEKCFQELGLHVKTIRAVDGRGLEMIYISNHIKLLPGYEDPYHKRPMKSGEVGCFMSHYKIWQEVNNKGYDEVLILEDDVNFLPNFRQNLVHLLDDLKNLDWDLVYVGRKVLSEDDEERTSQYTVRPKYSYWTIGYLLRGRGARKLLDAEPLAKLLPVDEFLPIMFNEHPNDTWKNFFKVRNLQALSAYPLLIEPARYVNQPGYVSDTEDSQLLPELPEFGREEMRNSISGNSPDYDRLDRDYHAYRHDSVEPGDPGDRIEL